MKCTGDKACVFPAVDGSELCAWHLRDKQSSNSDMGSTMQLFDSNARYGYRLHRGQAQVKHGNSDK